MNIRSSGGRWIDFSNACRNVPSAWTETSYSYSVFGISRCQYPHWNWVLCYVPFSFRTFPYFLNPSTTRGRPFEASVVFQSKRSPILSTITEQWKWKVFIPNFYIYPKRNILFEFIPINFDFTVHSQFKNLCPKRDKIVYFLSKRFITKNRHPYRCTGKKIGVAPFLQGEA